MQFNLTLSTLLISDSLDMMASYLLRYRFAALAGERFGRLAEGLPKRFGEGASGASAIYVHYGISVIWTN